MTTQYGLNTQPLQSSSNQYTLNALNESAYWILATNASTLGGTTQQEWNLWTDADANPISTTIGRNGTTLTACYPSLFCRAIGDAWNYPAGPWKLTWTGRASFIFARDISGSTSGPSPVSITASPSAGGMAVGLTSTGLSSTSVTFSGTTVSWSGSSFTVDTPVAFQGGSGTLPGQVTAGAIYYVIAAGLGANSFSISSTVGGSAISFTGSSGNCTGCGDWARNISLILASQYSYLGTTFWNPDYKARFMGVAAFRHMQMMHTYRDFMRYPAATYSGSPTTFTLAGHGLSIDETFMVTANGAVPTGYNLETAYYVIANGYTVNTFQASATKRGSPITLTGGSGSILIMCGQAFTDDDIPTANYLPNGGNGSQYGAFGLTKSYAGPSPEALCGLSNETNADLWICIPLLARTSWSTAYATRVKAALNTSRKVYVEYGNEMWSFAPGLQEGLPEHGAFLFTPGATGTMINNYTIYQNMVHFAAWKAVFTGADRARLVCVLGSQAGNGQARDDFMLGATTANTNANGSYWTGTSGSNADAICVGGYMTGDIEGQLPTAWTASDGNNGITNFYTQYNSGGILPRNSGNVQTGWLDTIHAISGGPTTFTLTSGQSLPATPANGTLVLASFPLTPSGAATLQVDGGNPYPLQDRFGVSGSGAGVSGGDNRVLCFTSATIPTTGRGSVPGAGPAGWRVLQTLGYSGSHNGQIYEALDWSNIDYGKAQAVTGSQSVPIRCLSYECGQFFCFFGNPDDVQVSYVADANRSSQMGSLYTTFFSQFNSYGFKDLVMQYCDCSLVAGQSQFGLLENIYQTSYSTVPKYQAYMALVRSAIILSPSGLPNGTVGTPYPTTTITASGGTGPYTFSSSPSPPFPGVTLTSAGVLSGTPTTQASYTFTITATDSTATSSSPQSYNVAISAAAPPPSGTQLMGQACL